MSASLRHHVIMSVADRQFAIPVDHVRDALGPQRLSAVPLAPRIVAGALSHRGRIVTAIDLRRCLGFPDRDPSGGWMGLIVAHQGALYGLIVDSVDTVLAIDPQQLERPSARLGSRRHPMAGGLVRPGDKTADDKTTADKTAGDKTIAILEIGSLLDPVMAEAS